MLIEKGFIEEFECEIFLYELDGLKVVFLDKDCEEFAFNATIYNKHGDNKGLPHMVEHCIFGGSLNFDIKEPFEYLVQNKRYTYLNAITFRDRIVCPFSTYSIEDFDEILDVYLDAVFKPFLREKTFKQECVRLENLSYNGIVLNEMIEMYSDKEYKKEDELLSVFKQNYLKYNAHGNPKDILNVKYNDIIDYYHKNFTRDNILLSFYGKFDHTKYLSLIEDIAKNCSYYAQDEITVRNNKLDVKTVKNDNGIDIVFSYESENVYVEGLYDLFFEYLANFDLGNLKKEINKTKNIKSIDVRKKLELRKKLVFISVLKECSSDFELSDLLLVFNEMLEDFNDIFFNEITLEKLFVKKNRDYGYKTRGIHSLIESSKVYDQLFEYYDINSRNSLEFNDNQSEFKLSIYTLFLKFKDILMSKYIKIYDNCNISEEKKDVLKKNWDNYFLYSTEYDIINAIIIINYDIIGLLSKHDLNRYSINDDYFENIDCIKSVYSSRMQSETHDIDGFYLHISILKKSSQNIREILDNILKGIKFNQLFKENICEYSENLNCDKLIEVTLNQTSRTFEKKFLENDKYLTFDIDYYLFFDDIIVKQEYTDKICVKDSLINSNIVKKSSKLFNSILFKNILILDIKTNCDLMYLELVLETLVNERIYPKVRLENGAYDVGYKILKFEYKIVLYSSVDRNSEETLSVFKREIEKIDEISLSDFKKYLNKITNNFYRNEQNKSIKIMKIFYNYILNINDTISNFDVNKLNEAINAVKLAETIHELSFGNESYKDYKNGGIYVY